MEDQRAHPAEIVIPGCKRGISQTTPGTEHPAKRERSARTSGEKWTRAFFKAAAFKSQRGLLDFRIIEVGKRRTSNAERPTPI